jgi:bifunctional ADP-heptose synthase (sugar kinase/adenylyltransferase)
MLATGGSVEEACAVSMLAASVVVHQLGTAGVVFLAAMEALCERS